MGDMSRKEVSPLTSWLYGSGNLGNCLVFTFVGAYVMFYYTNVLGISAATAGTIFLVARLIDAFTDPLMGMIVDHTNTKMGKFRPYVTFGAPFLGVVFVMMFSASVNWSLNTRIAYAYIAYITYSLAYTVVQTPHLAMPVILSDDVNVRTKIQAIFQAVGSISNLLVVSFAIPAFQYFGGMENPGAWNKVALIYAVMGTVSLIISSESIKEYDRPELDKKAISTKRNNRLDFVKSLKLAFKNKALICVLVAYGTDMFANQITTALRLYFFKYNMNGRENLITYIGYIGTVFGILMIFFIQSYAKKFGKRIGIIIPEAMCLGFTLLLLVSAPRENVAFVMISFFGTTILFSLTNMLSRAAVLDAANWGEIRTGVDNSALINSSFTFINKCCQAFSMYFSGRLLSATGYDATLVQQPQGTLDMILLLMTIPPIIAYICSLVGMKFYPLKVRDEITLKAIQEAEERKWFCKLSISSNNVARFV